MYIVPGYCNATVNRLIEKASDAISLAEDFDPEQRALFLLSVLLPLLESNPGEIHSIATEVRLLSQYVPKSLWHHIPQEL